MPFQFRFRPLLLAGPALAALAFSSAAHAEAEQDREYIPSDIIVTGKWSGYAVDDGSTATKTPTPLINVPQGVSVLTRDQLDDQNVRQLNDALRYVAGVVMETGEGHRDEVFIRGQKTTADFFLNGLRDDAQYYRSLYNIERVEVLKGSNALTFGRGGGGGVINRVSKTARFDQDFVAADAAMDSFGAFSIGADINHQLSDTVGLRLNGSYEDFNNDRDFYEGRFIGFSPTLTARLGERTHLTASYTYDDDKRFTDRGVPPLLGRPLDNFDKTQFGDRDFNEAVSKVHVARLRLDHEFSDALSVNLTGQYAHYDKAYGNVVPLATNGTTVDLNGYLDAMKRENWIAQGNLVWQGKTGGIGHTLLAGFEATRQDTVNARANALFATGPGTTASRITVPLARKLTLPAVSLSALVRNRDSKLTVLAGYIQDQIEIGNVVQLLAGLRFESFDLDTVDRIAGFAATRKDEKWSPRLGLIVKPMEQVSLYTSYSESFLPAAGDQFFILSPALVALAPEKFENLEAGVKWAINPNLLLTAAVFQLERSNSQAPDPLNPGFVVLTGKSRARGAEFQLAGDLTKDFHVNFGYTYLKGKIRSATTGAAAGTTMEQAPKHQFTAWGRYDFTDRFGLGLGVIHSSKQFASLSNAVTLPGYTRVDAAAYFEVNEKISVQLNVENLFDADYYPSAHGDSNIQPGDPLNASIGVRVKF
jgi:catecholate siderophore receptor